MNEAFIRNVPALEAACAAVRAGGVAALDTEFVWRKTYRPRLGLAQMAGSDGTAFAVDCIFCTNPAALGAIIADPGVVKILHDPRQDLGHLRRYTGALPKNVFDTQHAAAFAGFPDRLGLQKLLLDAIGVGLPKTETLADWTHRPLSNEELEYALDDVRYLAPLREELLRRAAELGTRDWLEEDMARYDDPALYADDDPEEAWRKVKPGKVRLGPLGRAVLRALAAERERRACLWDMPRNWVGDDASLVAVAFAASEKGAGGSLAPSEARVACRIRERPRRDLLASVYASVATKALALPEAEWPTAPDWRLPPETVDAADKALDWLRQKAAALHVDPIAVASRAVVTAFVANPDDPTSPLASGWRQEVFGREIASRFSVPTH